MRDGVANCLKTGWKKQKNNLDKNESNSEERKNERKKASREDYQVV